MGQLVGYQHDARVCVAVFMPPNAGAQLEAWRKRNADPYGPREDWVINIGRAEGGDFASVWVPKRHLPADFPIGKPLV
jgi:hypothetical protein